MLSLHRALIRLRRDTEALVSGGLKLLSTTQHVLAYERRFCGECVRVLLNLSDQTQTFRVEGAAQERLLSTYLDGAGRAKSEDVLLRANEGLILRETSGPT